MADLNQLAENLVSLTVKDVQELASILKEKYGIEPAAAATVAVSPANAEEEAAPEKTEFDIVLKSAGAKKLAVVKAVKTILGVGLKDAKGLVDGAPTTIKEGVAKAEAEEIKTKLEATGAEVELK